MKQLNENDQPTNMGSQPMVKDEAQHMNRISLAVFLRQLDQDGLNVVKHKFAKGSKHFVDAKANPVASAFLDVLCSSSILNTMTTDRFEQVITAIFPDWILDMKWLQVYCDYLLHSIDAVKSDRHDMRADRYEQHLRNRRIPAFKKQLQDAKEPFDATTSLLDIYKVAVLLYRYYAQKDAGTGFSTHLSRTEIYASEKSLRRITVKGFLNINIEPYKPEERQYAILLSWIMTEILCVQEGVETEVPA